jgi:long-chain acyl-CoA synthetase
MADPDAATSPLYRSLELHARSSPDKPALSRDGTTLTYAQLLAEVDARARSTKRTAGEGWSILCADDKLEFALDYLAAARLNAPLVVAERVILTDAMVRCLERSLPEVLAMRLGGPEVMFTSGSSAQPKAVLLDGHEMFRKAEQINTFVGNQPDTVEVLCLPLVHSFGLGRFRCAIAKGQSIVLANGLGSAERLRDALRRPNVGLGLVSSMVKLVLSRYPGLLEENSSNISYLEIGSEPLEPEYRQQLVRLLSDARLCLHYGMTELSRAAMVDVRRGPATATVGSAMPDTEIGIDDGAGGVHAAGSGEISLRGAAMLRAYLDGNGMTQIPPGTWLRTGDRGDVDETGQITVSGRLSNIVKILGENVVPEETERLIRPFPSVLDCVCVRLELLPGVDILAALIETDGVRVPDQAQLHDYLRRNLPAHQVPRRFICTGQLPRLGNGKIDRKVAAVTAAACGAAASRAEWAT